MIAQHFGKVLLLSMLKGSSLDYLMGVASLRFRELVPVNYIGR